MAKNQRHPITEAQKSMENSNEEKDLTEVWCDTEFDVPRDQLARNKRLEQHQPKKKVPKLAPEQRAELDFIISRISEQTIKEILGGETECKLE
jgi:hypothetical protein